MKLSRPWRFLPLSADRAGLRQASPNFRLHICNGSAKLCPGIIAAVISTRQLPFEERKLARQFDILPYGVSWVFGKQGWTVPRVGRHSGGASRLGDRPDYTSGNPRGRRLGLNRLTRLRSLSPRRLGFRCGQQPRSQLAKAPSRHTAFRDQKVDAISRNLTKATSGNLNRCVLVAT